METDGTDSYKLRFDEIRYKVNTNSCSLQLTHFTFYINSELGRGKYGVVHLVKEKGTQKPLAAKCIKTRKRVNILFISVILKYFLQQDRERAEEEICILKRLSHEKIIKYEGSYSSRTEFIILLEYLDGGELFERISEEGFRLTEADCRDFLTQICEGVGYLHSQNILHLDLKVGRKSAPLILSHCKAPHYCRSEKLQHLFKLFSIKFDAIEMIGPRNARVWITILSLF